MWTNIAGAVTTVCISGVLLDATTASAQTYPPRALASADSFAGSVTLPRGTDRVLIADSEGPRLRDWTWGGEHKLLDSSAQPIRAPRQPARHLHKQGGAYRTVQRVLAGAALGLVGFYAGGTAAFAIGSACACGGNREAWLGGGIGAAAGATAGILLVR